MIEIKITGETPQDALAQIIALARSASLETEAQPSAPKHKKQAETKVPVPQPPVGGAPTSGEQETPSPPPVKATYTLEQVRAKGLAVARTHGQPAVKTLLDEFGAANMTNLAPEQYPAFIERLEGLGGGNA